MSKPNFDEVFARFCAYEERASATADAMQAAILSRMDANEALVNLNIRMEQIQAAARNELDNIWQEKYNANRDAGKNKKEDPKKPTNNDYFVAANDAVNDSGIKVEIVDTEREISKLGVSIDGLQIEFALCMALVKAVGNALEGISVLMSR